VPLYPLILAIFIRIFGEGAAGEVAIRVLTAAGASFAYALLPYLSELSLSDAAPGVLAGIVGALLPLTLWTFIAGTNQPIAAGVMVALAILFVIVQQPRRSFAWTLLLGIAAGLSCLFSAPFLTVFGMSAITAFVLRPKGQRLARVFAVIGICIVVALAPWAIRNRLVLGRMIWTRSNFGTDFAQSNNSDASPVLNDVINSTKWHHPLYDDEERRKITEMGECAYNDAKLATAIAWIKSNPARFVTLCAERAVLFWFPLRNGVARTVIGDAESLMGMLGLALLLIRRNPQAWLFLGMLVGYFGVFCLVTADPRYSFPVEPLLLLLGAYFVADRIGALAAHPQDARSRAPLSTDQAAAS
jgi:4-amino-4-deoxy-L-arabinose transferase-like glycosyltransferase